jgi:methyltransferase (TIGR00027 family)
LSTYGRSPTFTFLAARTLFFDQAVTRALDDGVRQVVIIGAGYDSRALRLARPSVRFFEVDHPATQAEKRRRAPAAGVVYVPVDLLVDRLDDALVTAGFAADVPAVFIIEGLTMYLTKTATHNMFARLATLAAPGSHLAAKFSQAGGGSISPMSRVVARTIRMQLRLSGETTHYWATSENVPPMLLRTGWTPGEPITGQDLAATHLAHTTLASTGVNPKMFCITAHRTST